jgi:hypothetical protein
MNGELLLHWMSGMKTGRWPAFRRAVENLLLDESRLAAPLGEEGSASVEEADAASAATGLRYRLVELGHVSFDTSRHWQIEAPRLLGFEHEPNRWYLAGARSPQLLERLNAACVSAGCTIRSEEWKDAGWLGLPLRWWVEGESEAVRAASHSAGLYLVPCGFVRFRQNSQSVLAQWNEAPFGEGMHNWDVFSFDLHQKQWVEGELPGTAQEWRNDYQRLWLVEHQGVRRQLPKREAVYAAAALRPVILARYEPQTRSVRVPFGAPLPEACAQLLCLAAGRPSRPEAGSILYEGVPLLAAALVFETLGQRFPSLF